METIDDADLAGHAALVGVPARRVLWILFAWIVLSFDYDTVWAVAVFFGFGLIAGGSWGS